MTVIESPASAAEFPAASTAAPRGPTLLDTIDGNANNYTLIRLLLASSVIYFHSFALVRGPYQVDPLSRLLLPITSVGGLAVQCFFLLSGLFVTQSYLRDPNVFRFAIRRAARIWPGLIVCLLTTTLLAAFLSQGVDAWKLFLLPDILDYVANNGRLKMDFFVTGIYENAHAHALNGSLYTLPVEVGLYAILAVAGLLSLLQSRLTLIATSAALLCATWLRPEIFTVPLGVREHGQFLVAMFFAGCLLSGLAARIRLAGWQLVPLGALAWISDGPLHTVAFFALATWVMLYLGQSPILQRWFPLRQDWSFGVYIYGYPCQQMLVCIWPEIRPAALTAMALPLALLFAAASWRWIEQPSIRFGQEVTARWRSRKSTVITVDAALGGWPTGTSLIVVLLGLYLLIVAAAVLTRLHA